MSSRKTEDVNPPVSYQEIREAHRNGNKPKMDWVKNAVMSIEEFNRLKLAESENEYKEMWAEIEQEREQRAQEESEWRDRQESQFERR
jgi:hypothetical protein